jgi:hypothetical protein
VVHLLRSRLSNSRRLVNRSRRVGALVALMLGTVVLAGCRTDVDVAVDQKLNGTGEVRVTLLLDQEAAAQAGDLRRTLRVKDLEAAGWRLIGPKSGPTSGSVKFEVVKGFGNPGEASLALNELTGQNGPFGQLLVDRTRTPIAISSSVLGDIDLRQGYDAFGDALVSRAMASGSPIGVEPTLMTARYGAPLEQLMPLTLTVSLPGQAPRVVQLPVGEVTKVSVRSTTWNTRALTPLAAFVVGLLTLFVLAVRKRRRRRNEA